MIADALLRRLPQPLHVVLPIGQVRDQHRARQNDAEGGPTQAAGIFASSPGLRPPPRRSAQPGYGEGLGEGLGKARRLGRSLALPMRSPSRQSPNSYGVSRLYSLSFLCNVLRLMPSLAAAFV